MSLVEKIEKCIAPSIITAVIVGAAYLDLVSHKTYKDMNAKLIYTVPLTIACDKDRDGNPDFVLECWLVRAGGGYFSNVRMRPVTEEEARIYKSK